MGHLKRLLANKTQVFQREYWEEARECMVGLFPLGHVPRAFVTPMIPEDEANEHTNSVIQVAGNRSNQLFEGGSLRVLSYNIWRNYNPETIRRSLEYIRDHVDIILLQEDAMRKGKLVAHDEIFADWDFAYGRMHQPDKQTEYFDFEHSGQTILSRYKMEDFEVYQLPKAHQPEIFRKGHLLQRIGLYGKLSGSDGKNVGIHNIHLCNMTRPSGRRRQIEFVLQQINQKCDQLPVIGGDFNTFAGPFESGLHELKKAGYENNKRIWSPMDLDHIFTPSQLQRVEHDAGGWEKHPGSDHLPTNIVEILF